MIRREQSVLFVTDGLSSRWNPELHADAPEWTFGFEAAVEVPLHAFGRNVSEDALAASWAPTLLWAATDWLVVEKADLRSQIEHFQVITSATPPVAGLEHLVASNGFMGVMVGLPIAGNSLGARAHSSIAPNPARADGATWLLPFKLLTASEYEWVMGVQDSSRAMELALEFLVGKSRHMSWPDRPSELGHLDSD